MVVEVTARVGLHDDLSRRSAPPRSQSLSREEGLQVATDALLVAGRVGGVDVSEAGLDVHRRGPDIDIDLDGGRGELLERAAEGGLVEALDGAGEGEVVVQDGVVDRPGRVGGGRVAARAVEMAVARAVAVKEAARVAVARAVVLAAVRVVEAMEVAARVAVARAAEVKEAATVAAERAVARAAAMEG